MRRFFNSVIFVLISSFIVSCGTCNVAGLNTQTSVTDNWKNTGTDKGPQSTGFQDFIIGIFADQIVDTLFGKKQGSDAGIVGDRKFQDGIIYQLYKGIVETFEYRAVYYLVVVLYITILGITYLLGMSPMTMDKMIPLVIKIGVISMFTNPAVSGDSGLPIGWDYYNHFIVSPALRSMEQFAIYFCAVLFDWNVKNVTNGFIPLTVVLGMLATKSFWIKMTSLILTNVLMGLPTFLIVLLVMASFFVMMLFGIIAYIVTLVMLGMLFALGPFFFMFLLFEKTKPFFTRWMSNIISLMLQQYTLFITVAIFGFIISQSLESMLAFKMKCTPIIAFNLRIPIFSPLPKVCRFFGGNCDAIEFTYPIWSYYTMATNDNSTFLTLFMYSIFLYMLIKLFGAMVEYTSTLGSELVAGSVNAGKGAASSMKAMGDKAVGWAEDKVGGALGEGAKKVMALPYNAATGKLGDLLKKKDKKDENKDGDDHSGKEAGKAAGKAGGKAAGKGAGLAVDAVTGGATGGAGSMIGGALGGMAGEQLGGAAGEQVDNVKNEIKNQVEETVKAASDTVQEGVNVQAKDYQASSTQQDNSGAQSQNWNPSSNVRQGDSSASVDSNAGSGDTSSVPSE